MSVLGPGAICCQKTLDCDVECGFEQVEAPEPDLDLGQLPPPNADSLIDPDVDPDVDGEPDTDPKDTK